MAVSFVELMNKTIPHKVNKSGEVHKHLIGDEDFTPDDPIESSSSFNCGALSNEFEFARKVTGYYASAMRADNAEGNELNEFIQSLVDLPRRSLSEPDSVYRNRFKFLVVAKTNYRRTTKWAILDSISYFIDDTASRVQLIEPFKSSGQYFEVRIEGVEVIDDAITLDDPNFGYIDSYYLSGSGISENISYIGALLDRIKAAGVDYNIMFIDQYSSKLTSNATIGRVQLYIRTNANILSYNSVSVTSNAEVI